MKITIIGVGKVGKVVTEYLSNEGHDIVIIDTNADLIEELVNIYDVKGVVGNGASLDIQLEAEVDKADILIATTGSDELNILCSLVAKKNNVKHTIVRVRNPEYSKQMEFMYNELGVNLVVNPELEAANEIFKLLKYPSSSKINYFANEQAEIVELQLTKDSMLVGKPLYKLHSEFGVRFLVSTVERNNQVYIPSGNFVLEENDKIFITASHEDINTLFKKLKVFKQSSRKVMIIGGGKISYYLATQLIKNKIKVKIIEFDKVRCNELSDLLPEAEIIFGDGSDQSLLIEEGLKDVDAFVSLTGFDEENIIMSLFAETVKVPKVITKTNHHSYSNILEKVGLGSAVSPKYTTALQISRYVRSLGNTVTQVRNLYKIVNDQIEVAEFYITETCSFTNKTFKELEFKPNVLIACIVRDNKVIIPTGADYLLAEDSVVVVTTIKHLKEFQDVLLKV
ncbi:MAG: Trk system potassium transporter TrkA [Bacilli bacterium]